MAKDATTSVESPAPKAKSRDDLMNELLALTRDRLEEEAAKKRDAKAHADRISDIKASIKSVTDQLKALEDQI